MNWNGLELPDKNIYFKDETDSVIIYCDDCRNVLPLIPDKSIDLVLTDPPFNLDIGQKKYTGVYGSRGNHLDKIKESFGYEFDPLLFIPLIVSKMRKVNGYFWGSQALLPIYLNYAIESELVWDVILWCKANPIPAHFNHRLTDIEFCVYMHESGVYFNNELDYSSYFSYFVLNLEANPNHPTPKPEFLMGNIVLVSAREEDIILDPFLGSGTTAYCAKKLGRKCIGIEIEERYCEISAKRCSQSVMRLVSNGS